jgi:hypothetical protein
MNTSVSLVYASTEILARRPPPPSIKFRNVIASAILFGAYCDKHLQLYIDLH